MGERDCAQMLCAQMYPDALRVLEKDEAGECREGGREGPRRVKNKRKGKPWAREGDDLQERMRVEGGEGLDQPV